MSTETDAEKETPVMQLRAFHDSAELAAVRQAHCPHGRGAAVVATDAERERAALAEMRDIFQRRVRFTPSDAELAGIAAPLVASRAAVTRLEAELAREREARAAPVEPARVPQAGDVWRDSVRDWTFTGEKRTSGDEAWEAWSPTGVHGSRSWGFWPARRFTDGTLTFVRSSAEPTTTGGAATVEASGEQLLGMFVYGMQSGAQAAGLTFAAFSKANRERCEAPRASGGFGRTLSSMSVAAMALAAAGEMGEVCDGVYNVEHNPDKGITNADVIDEIGDTAAYLDLLAQRHGSTLEEAIANKWDRVSAKRGYPGRLAATPGRTPGDVDGGK